jgi:DNA polymerase-3 subunit epsilon
MSSHPLSKQSLKDLEIVCLDCETTGLDPENDRVIELAVVIFRGSEVLYHFESLIDPRMEIPEESRKIHGIRQEMVLGKPGIESHLPEILKAIGTRPIMGHGIGFDLAILKQEAIRHHLLWPLESNLVLDTLRMARLYGQSPVNSLEMLRQHFNIAQEGSHRALSDVLVNIQVFEKLSRSHKTLGQLLDDLSKPIEMKVMPLGKHKGRLIKEIPLDYLKWAVRKDFDQDLIFSIKQEIRKRQKGQSFNQASNPFSQL